MKIDYTSRNNVIITTVAMTLILVLLSLALIYESVRHEAKHINGTLTAYDMNLNPKYTFSGNFEYITENTWLDRNTGIYYTFDRAIVEPNR